MATLKDHQQAMVDLLASGSGIPASASRLAHAMHDVLVIVNNLPFVRPVVECGGGGLPDRPFLKRPDATTPGLNDKALAADVEACRPKDTMFDRARAAERRVKELENTVKQLRTNNAKLRAEIQWLNAEKKADEPEQPKCACLPEYYETCDVCGPPEQAGVRKDDTQVCEHLWAQAIDSDFRKCVSCGAVEDLYL